MKADNSLDSSSPVLLDPARRSSEKLTESPLDAFRQDLELRGLAKETIDRHYHAVKRYSVWCSEGGHDPSKALETDLLGYLSVLRVKKMRVASLRQNFASLSVYFAWLARKKLILVNPVPELKAIYLRPYKDEVRQRQLISVEDAAKMVRATIDIRDRAILLLFLKTGIRRNELISLDLEDIDLMGGEIELKPTGKRSNRIVFFDDECSRALARWLKSREMRFQKGTQTALFISGKGTRLQSSQVDRLVCTAAERVGLHDSKSPKLEAKFGPHCCRHFFTTHLRRAGMPREFIQELRGDVRREAIDIYDHIDKDELRKSYLAHVPRLGV